MSDKSPVTIETIIAAETIMGVSYTPQERALMLDNLAPQIDDARLRRVINLAGVLPAMRFDPRLSDFVMPSQNMMKLVFDATPLPQSEEEIAFAPIVQLAVWIRSGALKSVNLTKIYLDRIAKFNTKLLCFVTLTADAALARAKTLDEMLVSGIYLGALHGIPYGMKDIIDTEGVETAWGAEPYRGRVPAEDAHITKLLHEAGAVLLGKTTVGALAYGDLWYGGRTRNPWNLQEGSSGSSAGSASAVAAGLAAFAIGTETLGSIVAPSTRCGTVGLRPTHGRVSRRGAMALCWSLDKIGPICRGIDDTAIVLNALNGTDGLDPAQIPAAFHYEVDAPIQSLRLGYYPEDFEHDEANALDASALEAARALGVELIALTRSDLPYDSLMGTLFAEAAAAFEDLTLSNRDDELNWQDDDAWPNSFRKARFLSAVDHVQLDRFRRLVMQEMDKTFKDVDVIIGPSQIGPMLVITNFTGHPCLCFPSGFLQLPTREPVSLTKQAADIEPAKPVFSVPGSICLWGRLFEEGPMLNIGRALANKLALPPLRPKL